MHYNSRIIIDHSENGVFQINFKVRLVGLSQTDATCNYGDAPMRGIVSCAVGGATLAWGLTAVAQKVTHSSPRFICRCVLLSRRQIRFPDLSCEFAAVDSVDMIGDRRHDLSGSAVYKCAATLPLSRRALQRGLSSRTTPVLMCPTREPPPARRVPTGGQLVAVEHAAKTSTEAPVYGNSTNLGAPRPLCCPSSFLCARCIALSYRRVVLSRLHRLPVTDEAFPPPPQPRPALLREDHYGNVRISMEVTADNFAKLLDTYDALLLNFHAPWCPHCQRFAPVWEHAAELTRDGIFGPSKKREYFLKLGMGAVDCTTQQNIPLCRDQHIQAFPTVRVYRQGKNPLDKHAPSGGPTRHYEAYVGERSAEAVSAFALKVLEEMEDGTQTGTRGTDANRDGRPDSKLHARGCVIQGAVQVARVPGELHFVPTSRGHSLNMANVNMTHVIEHLSFGNPVAEAQTRGKWWEARAKAKKIKGDIFPRDMGGKYAMQQERDPFVSAKEHITHDHYIKVVPTQYTQLGKPEPVELYEYTISSNAYALEPPFMTSGESHDGPIVKARDIPLRWHSRCAEDTSS